MKKILWIFLSALLIVSVNCPQSFSQYVNKRRPNQRFLSTATKEQREKGYVAPDMVNVREFLYESIEALFENQGICTYDYMMGALKGHTPPSLVSGIQETLYDRRFRNSNLPTSTSPSKPIVLPEVMKIPNNLLYRPTTFNPFLPYPFMKPPHITNPITEPSSEKIDELPPAMESRETFHSSLEDTDLPVLPPPRVGDETKIDTQYESPSVPKNDADRTTPQFPLTKKERLLLQGCSAFRYRNYYMARNIFSTLLEENPQSSRAHFGYGIGLFYAGDYPRALQTIGRAYRIAKQNGEPEPSLWEINVNPSDFRYQHKKLLQYVNRNRHDKNAGTLLFLLTHAGVTPPE